MDYEKAYKEALKRAKKIYDNAKELRCVVEAVNIETIFPELNESEDEKIRKALINGVECCKASASGWTNFGNNVDIDVVLAWLEKQGEQKPTDKVEHECSCKYVGCHINNSRRWCHYLENELPYDMCNSYCPKYNIKPTEWSEEDEEMAEDLIKGFQSPGKAWYLAHTSKEIADWLKSLKDRVKGKEG